MVDTFRIAEHIKAYQSDWVTRRWVSHPASTETKLITIIEATIAPGQAHSFHRHPAQEEAIYILAGTVEQWVEREKRLLGPGDAAFIPPGVVHASFNAGIDDVRMLAIFSPCVGEGFETVEVAGEAPWKDLRK